MEDHLKLCLWSIATNKYSYLVNLILILFFAGFHTLQALCLGQPYIQLFGFELDSLLN